MRPDLPWATAPLVVCDFETSGLDPERDRFVEIGLAFVDNGQISGSVGWTVRRENLVYSNGADRVHNISAAEIEAGSSPVDTVLWLIRNLGARIPVAYSAHFDRRFLVTETLRLFPALAEAKYLPPFMDPAVTWIDPLVWVREFQKYEKGKSLVAVCKRLGIDLQVGHRAEHDAVATAQVLLRIANRMPPLYGDLCRLQSDSAARQELEHAAYEAAKVRT